MKRTVKTFKQYFEYMSRNAIRQRAQLSYLQSYLHCMKMGYAWLDKGENHVSVFGQTAREHANECFELAKFYASCVENC